ncbi:MAG: iron-containing alcohol dehydrogenase [Verrucomicrobiales bacterium]|nr:iron-containing alcohol dehydrogenase [Verrucomicrobiales bacterium]
MGELERGNGFDHEPRTRVVFGAGVAARLGKLAAGLGARRVLLVTDPGVVRAGHAGRLEASLRASVGIVECFTGVRENPDTACVDACLQVARSLRPDLLVGLGGGSAMDTAKGCNFLLTNGGEMRDYWGVGKATRPMLPLIAVPTTAGTGSECQSAALIADAQTHQKMACLDPKATARIALLDPELTLSQPPAVTAGTGIDALAHAVETAVTRGRNPVSLLYSHAAFRRLVTAFPAVLRDPGDVEARGQMLLGAAWAGMAIENSMLGAAHAAANPLTARCGVVHGLAVGSMLPHVIRFNAVDPEASRAYAELAGVAGIAGPVDTPAEALEALVRRIEALLEVAGLPRSLGAFGVAASMVPRLAEEAARQWTAGFNPRALTMEDFAALYRQALSEPAAAGAA